MVITDSTRYAQLAGRIGLLLAVATSAWGNEFATLRSGEAQLRTRWAAEVNATNAHPEYPRPQMVRRDWLNLNGQWDYAIIPSLASAPTNFPGKILVPFPVES